MKYNYFEGLFLLSEYTIGFELEGIAINYKKYEEFEKITNTYFKSSSTIKSIKDDAFVDDASINKPTPQHYPFEYRSPVFNLTPENISKIVSFIRSNLDKYITDESCSFHIHIGLPKTSIREDIETYWFLCQLVANELTGEFENKIKRFLNYKDFKFEGREQEIFAPLNNINLIKKALQNLGRNHGTVKRLVRPFTIEKYNFFRLHPQGTLEWRGPRGFITKETPELIKRFFFDMLIPLIKFMNDLIEKNYLVYNNFKISKKDFYELLKKENPTKLKINKFNKDMDKSIIKDIYMKAPWLKNAKFFNANISYNEKLKKIVFDEGIWEDGVWENGYFNGIWENGIWKNGRFEGIWYNGEWHHGVFSGDWYNGKWYNGNFNRNSRWHNGEWYNGNFKGKWFGGTFYNGVFEGGWADGEWGKGEFIGTYIRGAR